MNALAKKLQIKPNTNWLLFNPPANYLIAIGLLPDGVTVSYKPNAIFDGVQLFAKDSLELASSLKIIIPVIKPDTVLWIIYPKKNSGIKTDLEMMGSWDACKIYGLRPVSSAAVDDTWTALRFRHEEQVKTSEGRNDNIRQTEYSDYLDIDNKQIKLPIEIADLLQETPQALAFYQQLSYSNKKEYVLWILTAKQEKTRTDRLTKLVEKLLAGKKNPSEK